MNTNAYDAIRFTPSTFYDSRDCLYVVCSNGGVYPVTDSLKKNTHRYSACTSLLWYIARQNESAVFCGIKK